MWLAGTDEALAIVLGDQFAEGKRTFFKLLK